MAIKTTLTIALLWLCFTTTANAELISDVNFEDTSFTEHFAERWYSEPSQTDWDNFKLNVNRDAQSHSGAYSARFNLADGEYEVAVGTIGYGTNNQFGNTDGTDYTTEFDSLKIYYSFWVMAPAENMWAGNYKLIYQGYANYDCHFVLALHYNGTGNWLFSLINNTPPDGYVYNRNDYFTTANIQDGAWHHIEVFMDWSAQVNGCTYSCVDLDCVATTNPGTFKLVIDDVIEYERNDIVYVRDGVGTISPVLRTAIPANHSGDAAVDSILYLDDLEIWNSFPNDDVTPSFSGSGFTIQ